MITEHRQKFGGLDRKSEALERKARQLSVIVYNVPQTAEEDDKGADTTGSLFHKCLPDGPGHG